MNHVAVLLGGWSVERPVPLNPDRGFAGATALRGSRRFAPLNLKPKIYHKAQQLTQGVPRAPGVRRICRADFRNEDSKGEKGEMVRLEVNTQPDLTLPMAEAAPCDR
jgi:D-alanine-D-alanine ligase-like ATP-grasp enzyme